MTLFVLLALFGVEAKTDREVWVGTERVKQYEKSRDRTLKMLERPALSEEERALLRGHALDSQGAMDNAKKEIGKIRARRENP